MKDEQMFHYKPADSIVTNSIEVREVHITYT